MTKKRIGPRMHELLRILAAAFNGRAPSRHAAYSRLNYHGGTSNQYGDAVMCRLEAHGLVRRLEGQGIGIAVPVELTDKGREVLEEV